MADISDIEGSRDNNWGNILSSTVFAFIPSGWFYLNEVNFGIIYERCALPATDPINHQIYPKIANQSEGYRVSFHRRPWNLFVALFAPAFTASEQKFGYTQSAVDLATVACALERYRLAHDDYPASLAAVSPRFIESLPNDVIGGQPLNYRRVADGGLVLYSLGWNEVDDGGKVALTSSSRPDNSKGDWVWKY